MSSCSTSAMRRSRSVCDARLTAAAAAFSHDSVLVPTRSTILYTLSAIRHLLGAGPLSTSGRRCGRGWCWLSELPLAGVELGQELLRCHHAVGLLADLRHLVPVDGPVEAHTQP